MKVGHENTAPMTVLGLTRDRNPPRPFGIRQADRLFHMYIVGQTGTGKSSLLFNLAKRDAQGAQGFCLIDPHGDLAEQVSRIAGSDSLYWDVADPSCPLGYNPLTPVSAAHRPLVASGLISTLKKQWADAWGARMEHLLRFALLALLERPASSIADIMPLFLNKEFRRSVVPLISDPYVRKFWTVEFPSMNYKTAADGVAPIANKLGAFLAHPVVRRAVCEPQQPLRFRQVMDEGRVLVVNLSKGRLGADVSNILGGMIVSNIAHASYSRQDQPVEKRRPFFLIVDEFQSYTTTAFVDMLSELRKYRLGLVLAHQYTTQLDEDVLEAIIGNVGTLISFRVGATDAGILSKQFGHDVPMPRDFIGLANYEMFIKQMIDGAQSKPFSAKTIVPK